MAKDEMDGITNSLDINVSKLWEIVEDRGAWYAAVHEAANSRTRLCGLNNNKFWGQEDDINA